MSYAQVAQSFSVQSEATNSYAYLSNPYSASVSTFLTSVYANLFNRAPDTVGLNYWTNEINSGRSNVGNAIINIISGAQDSGATLDRTTITNKMNAGLTWATTMSNIAGATYGANEAVSAKAIVASVTSDAATLTAANASTSSFFANGGGAAIGGSYVLGTGTDTTVGTAGNDTFSAVAATTSPTWNASDAINGGAGTDTLNLTIDTLGANSVSAGTTTNIEIINVRNVSGNAQTIVAGNFINETTVVSDRSTSGLTITGLTSGVSVGVNGDGVTTNSTLADSYASSVTAATLNVTNGVTAGAITQTAAGVTAQTINSTGAANTIGGMAIGGAATSLIINATTTLATGNITGFTGTAASITVNGAAANSSTNIGVNLGTIENTTVATINAAGLTAGGLQAILNTNTSLVVTGGQGNDRITTGSALGTGSVNAGAGTADRLSIAADAHMASLAIGNKYSGFEIIELAAGAAQDMSFLATNNNVTGLRLLGSATVSNINAATTGNITVLASGTDTFGVVGATNPGQIDTVTLTVSDESSTVNTITLTTPTLSGIENLNLVATDNITIGSMANAATVSKLVVSGAGAVNITTGAVATVLNSTVDASALTGTFTYTAAATTGANAQSITGSATKANTITGTGNGDIIVGGSAADTIANETTADASSGSDVLTGGGGFNTFILRGDTTSGTVSTILGTTSRVTDFKVGTTTTTTDFLSLDATVGNYTASGASTGFAAGVATGAAGATAIQSVQQSNGATAYVAGTDLIKLTTAVTTTGTLQAAFNAAIGTSTITAAGNDKSIFFTLYDSTNSRMLVGIVNDASTTATVIESGDTVTLVGSLNMTAADYANFSANSLIIN